MKIKVCCLLIVICMLCGCSDESEKTEGIVMTIPSMEISQTSEESIEPTQTLTQEATAAPAPSPTPAPSPAPTPSPTPTPEPESVTILMVGDILLHTPVEAAAKQEDGNYSFDRIFENMQEDIQSADLSIVNQEVIIGGEELGISGYPAFNAPYAVGHDLMEAGFDVICHGTNHALDKGKRGLVNCLNFWQDNYPETAVLGIHDSQEAQDEIYVYEQGNIRIAVLNFTYGTNGIPLPADMPYAVDLLEEEKVKAAIQKAESMADFTIVCPHWGTEYQLKQSAAQEKWAKVFAECGADLVLGTHPHVIQPVEWVNDEASGNEMLVYYSLGNFVNWTSSSGEGIANRMVGGMVQVTLTLEEEEVVISEYGVEPVVCHLEEGINGVTVYKLSEYTEELAEENQIRLQDDAFSLAYCEELCRKVWGEDYMFTGNAVKYE